MLPLSVPVIALGLMIEALRLDDHAVFGNAANHGLSTGICWIVLGLGRKAATLSDR